MSCGATEKGFVTREKNVCPVCGHAFNTGSILMHKHLKKVFDPATVTGMSLCPTHQKQLDEGYIFLVEVKNGTVPEGAETLSQKDANRTGVIAAIRRRTAAQIFEGKELQDINFVDEQVIPQLEQLMCHVADNNESTVCEDVTQETEEDDCRHN